MKGTLHNEYKILKNLYTKKTLCIHNLEKITKNRITLTTFYIHDLLITKLYAYWTFVLAQFKHCTLTYKSFVLIFTFYIKRITACTFQNIVLLDKKNFVTPNFALWIYVTMYFQIVKYAFHAAKIYVWLLKLYKWRLIVESWKLLTLIWKTFIEYLASNAHIWKHNTYSYLWKKLWSI